MNKDKKDIDIIKEILDWNIELFSLIIERYEEKLYKYIIQITNIDNQDVEDLLQDIFIKVYKKLNEYNSNYKFSNWIYKITYNYILDNYKKINKKNKNELDLDKNFINNNWDIFSLLDIIEDKNNNIEDNVKRNELFLLIRNSILKLEPKYKNVLILKYFHELSYDEISDIMRIPINSVWTLINRAKKRLKNELLKSNILNYL